MLGTVTEGRDGFRLTEVGALLRADAPGSMRALALMYGGPFHESFAALGHTVRTGEAGFEHLFGENHFDHFARDPHLADLFDRSMAAGAAMFDPVPTHPALTRAAEASAGATVVDVAGGNGEVLGRVLAAHPRLNGVLLERPHAAEAARLRLEEAGLGGRCTFLAGDFADVPAGGDVYLLSRVLHDGEDERCREILRHCAGVMPDHADLLVVERVLPSDGSASLAIAVNTALALVWVRPAGRRTGTPPRPPDSAGRTAGGRTRPNSPRDVPRPRTPRPESGRPRRR